MSDPAVHEKLKELHDDWKEFSKGLNVWKTKIEKSIRQSKEYETVISKAEEIVIDLHQKKQEDGQDEEIEQVLFELCDIIMSCPPVLLNIVRIKSAHQKWINSARRHISISESQHF